MFTFSMTLKMQAYSQPKQLAKSEACFENLSPSNESSPCTTCSLSPYNEVSSCSVCLACLGLIIYAITGFILQAEVFCLCFLSLYSVEENIICVNSDICTVNYTVIKCYMELSCIRDI